MFFARPQTQRAPLSAAVPLSAAARLAPLPLQVGASNELPESEELDALYDRFLLRRQVSQVSQAGLLDMLANGGGRKQVGGGAVGRRWAETASVHASACAVGQYIRR